MVLSEPRLCRSAQGNLRLLQKAFRHYIFSDHTDPCHRRRQRGYRPLLPNHDRARRRGNYPAAVVCMLRAADRNGRRCACYHQHKERGQFPPEGRRPARSDHRQDKAACAAVPEQSDGRYHGKARPRGDRQGVYREGYLRPFRRDLLRAHLRRT